MNCTRHASLPLPKFLDVKVEELKDKKPDPGIQLVLEKKKKKKRKEKKKKKKPENEQDKSKGYLGFVSKPRQYTVPKPKKKQTDPPSIPVSQQFPDGNFPPGEFMNHAGDL
jgi:methionyl aminopeptidase